jgi:hypothetical protein
MTLVLAALHKSTRLRRSRDLRNALVFILRRAMSRASSLTTTSTSACATSSPDGTRWQGAVRVGSPSRLSTENLAYCVSNACPDMPRRVPAVKPVGEPDIGNRYVRFDERGWETERWPFGPKLPRPSSTLPNSPFAALQRFRQLFEVLLP